MSPSADWELQVLLVELVKGCGGVSLGSTYPDDSKSIVLRIYVCRLKRELRSLQINTYISSKVCLFP